MIYEMTPDPGADRAISEQELWAAAEGTRIALPEAAEGMPQDCEAAAGPRSLADARDDRNALLCLLVYAARNLAAAQITIASGFERITICASCGEQALAGIPLRHKFNCLSAEVTQIIERLIESEGLDLNFQRREDKQRSEDAGAGEGNHSRIAYREPWEFERGPSPGMFCINDCDGRTRVIVSGQFVDRLDTAERIVACVNFCSGNSTELLTKLKAAAEGKG